MDRRKAIFFFSGVVLWAVFVAALVVYLFFPYQKALKIALQNVIGSGRTAVAMEGVSMKTMGISATRLRLSSNAGPGQTAPFELTNVDISWNPFSLLTGKLVIKSKASVYDGMLRCTVDGIPFTGLANPKYPAKLEHVESWEMPRRRASMV